MPQLIAAGPDGALWFTAGAYIGRITTPGVVTEYPVPDRRVSARRYHRWIRWRDVVHGQQRHDL